MTCTYNQTGKGVIRVPSRFVEVENGGGLLVKSAETGKLYRDTKADHRQYKPEAATRR